MRLIDYIKKRKINPKDFAAETGLHFTTIYRIMGGAEPKAGAALKIITATAGVVSLADLADVGKNGK